MYYKPNLFSLKHQFNIKLIFHYFKNAEKNIKTDHDQAHRKKLYLASQNLEILYIIGLLFSFLQAVKLNGSLKKCIWLISANMKLFTNLHSDNIYKRRTENYLKISIDSKMYMFTIRNLHLGKKVGSSYNLNK